jgi:hypothetical protein
MNPNEALNALDFDDNIVLDPEVGSMLATLLPFVENWDAHLPDEAEAGGPQLDAERLFVVGLGESWSEVPMYLDTATNDLVRQRIFFGHRRLLVRWLTCEVM